MITAAILAGLGLATGSTIEGIKRIDANAETRNYWNQLQQIKSAKDIKVSDRRMLDQIINMGFVDTKEYGTAIDRFSHYTEAYEKSSAAASGKSFSEYLNSIGRTDKTARQVGELYRILINEAPRLYDGSVDVQDTINGLIKNTPLAPLAPAPNLFNLDNYNPVDLPVDPVRMWTGQELANLHGIDYNFDNYYDLMKQGSQAQVALKAYENQQANVLGALQDEDTRVSYLDAIRNNRTKAMNKGISAGQRAANELLSMQDAMNQYSVNQSDIVNNQMSNNIFIYSCYPIKFLNSGIIISFNIV